MPEGHQVGMLEAMWIDMEREAECELGHRLSGLGARLPLVVARLLLLSKSLHVVLTHRLFHHLHRVLVRRRWLWLVARPPFEIAYRTLTFFIFGLKGVVIPYSTRIGPGLRLPHPYGIILAPQVELGCACTIFQGVTIGVNHLDRSGFPRLGRDVVVYPGAKVVGNVTVGDTVIIGANSVVVSDIPSSSVALGIPAVVKRGLDSLDRLQWRDTNQGVRTDEASASDRRPESEPPTSERVG